MTALLFLGAITRVTAQPPPSQGSIFPQLGTIGDGPSYTGNVGIGTLNPISALEVCGDITTVGGYQFLSDPTNAGWAGWQAVFKPGAGTLYGQSNGNSRVELTSAGTGDNRVVFSGEVVGGTLANHGASPAGSNLQIRLINTDGIGNYSNGAEIVMYNTATGTTNSRPTSIVFATTDVGHNADVERMVLMPNGYLGIGTANPNSLLSVNGTIQAKEVLVTTSGWSDYVFDKGYRLQPLSEVAASISAEHHLPGIPSATEVRSKGVRMAEMDAKLLAKIEELTLHAIAQEKRLDEQSKRIDELEQENHRLRDQP